MFRTKLCSARGNVVRAMVCRPQIQAPGYLPDVGKDFRGRTSTSSQLERDPHLQHSLPRFRASVFPLALPWMTGPVG